MKTKFALLFLPALMALSSCGAAAQPVANKTMLEDTTAHSEIFGNRDVVGGKLGIRNRAKNEAIAEPTIGYQIKYDSGSDKLAIRFVAAIKDLNVKAYWRRGVAGADGSELQSKSFGDTAKEVTNYYTSLSDGHTTITAGAEGDYADYVGFVVYSIYDIPYETNKSAYVAAYVNLVGDEDGDSDVHNNSKGLAVRIEKETNYTSKNVFSFDPTMNKHFLEGTIGGTVFDGGTNGLYERSDPERKGANNAWYENIQLRAGDSFGSFYYDHDRIFQYFGYSSYFDTAVSDFDESASLSGYATPKKEGKYNLYISESNSNHVYSNRTAYHVTFYFDSTTVDGKNWDPAPTGWFIHAYNGGETFSGAWGAGTMSPVSGEDHLYSYVLEIAVSKSIANVILGFNQGGDGKQTVSMSITISDTGVYDINSNATWTGSEMNATIAAR